MPNWSAFPNQSELPAIKDAIAKNIDHDREYLSKVMLAIRMAENGKPGREFGALNKGSKDTDLRKQAGEAAYSLNKRHKEWLANKKLQKQYPDFLDYFAKIWAPPQSSALNAHWPKNVKHWVKKF